MEKGNFQYRKAKPAHCVMAMANYFSLTCMFGIFNYASYVANVGYGIASAVIGIILMGSRIYDGISDPVAAVIIEKSNPKMGRIRFFSLLGWIIEGISLVLMFTVFSGKFLGPEQKWLSHGIFILLYLLFITGYTIHGCAVSITAPVMTNEPTQRARLGTISIAFNTLSYIFCVILIALCLLPMFDNVYTVEMLSTSAIIMGAASFVTLVIALIGVAPYDKPENYAEMEKKASEHGAAADNKISIRKILKGNRPLQMFLVAAVADGLATQVYSQSVCITLMYGVVTGNYQLGTTISGIAFIPALAFAFLASKYAAKNGNKKAIVNWTKQSILVAIISTVFFMMVPVDVKIADSIGLIAIFAVLMVAILSLGTCVSAATRSMLSDIVDYELARNGRYVPAVISAIYSFLNKLISSVASVIALGVIALVGYHNTLPQPGDKLTIDIKIATMFLFYGIMIIGWLISLVAMRYYDLDKEKMEQIQRELAGEPVFREATPEERSKALEEDMKEWRKRRRDFLWKMRAITKNQ